ncbi:hypothetical protein [Paenibacillus sonchi]|uniref:hypothetical protein n=1 Tax=Paenibacillus sonchi TaxID=373687 RepID=UPI001E6447BE|nr:hypothetical protein [Paenibacillus sonchi]MCE3198307.1 hypothetical protein [Paenibacillus sonchi]
MNEYKFTAERNQMIVDAIVDGYHDYVEHRKDRKSKMKISSAFAWTKGNYISGADLTDEDREVVAPEPNEDIMDPAAFDIGIFEDEQQQS